MLVPAVSILRLDIINLNSTLMNILFTNEHFYGTHHIRAETKIQNSLHIISTIQGVQKQSKFLAFYVLERLSER